MSNRVQRKAFEADVEAPVRPDETAEDIWRSARLIAVRSGGPYSHAISALTPILNEKVPTMAVDPYYRVYYSEHFLRRVIKEAEEVTEATPCKSCGATKHHPYAYIAGAIWHETQHPLRRHWDRFDRTKFADQNKANSAGDLEINDESIELFKALKEDADKNMGGGINKHVLMCLPPWVLVPSKFELKDHLSAEEYYSLLPDKTANQMNCGSGAGNNPGEWEVGEPGASGVPGIGEGTAGNIEKMVAADIQKCHGRGVGGFHGMIDWANQQIPPSQYNWKSELNKVTRILASSIFGFTQRNIRKFHKKSAASGFQTLAPATKKTTPNIVVLLDTSGSMFCGAFPKALGEIEAILKSVKGNVTMACADYDAGDIQVVKSLTKFKLTGGGGTSMRRSIIQVLEKLLADKKRKPDLLILITDLETDYPKLEEMRGVPLLIVGINRNKNVSYGDKIPEWAKFVFVPLTEE